MTTPAMPSPAKMARPIQFLETLPPRPRQIVAALRRVILRQTTGIDEAVKFGSLCYFQSGMPFGAIGGNICMIEVKSGEVRLGFIHGASLPDPSGLLRGTAAAKRFVPIESIRDARSPRIAELIRTSSAWVRSVSVQQARVRNDHVAILSAPSRHRRSSPSRRRSDSRR